ncbi:MAG: ammonia-forming cytochrome c nitrite reductase subunit c552, partial [Phycisphaerae bacterium]
HNFPEEELRARVETIQARTHEMRSRTMDALMELIADIRAAKERGATDEQLAAARDFQRKATFLLDFVEAENSTGFHADQEAARVLALSLDYVRKGQLAARDLRAAPQQAAASP